MEHRSPRHRNATERRNSIILNRRTEGFLSIGDLAQRLGVSHMTVRRDVRHLEGTGHVRVVYGGVSLSLRARHDSGPWINCDAANPASAGNGGSGPDGHGETSRTAEAIMLSDVTTGGALWRSPTGGGPTVMAPELYAAPNGSHRDRAQPTDAANGRPLR